MQVVPKRAIDFTDNKKIKGTRLVMVCSGSKKPKDPHQRNRLIGKGGAYCYKEEKEVKKIM